MPTKSQIDEVPHVGVKGEFVRKTGPSGWEEENEPNPKESMVNSVKDKIGNRKSIN